MTSFFSSLFPSALAPTKGAQNVAGFKCGWHEDIGRRPTLEDRVAVREFVAKPFDKKANGGKGPQAAFFAVFDGHGGEECAAYLEKHLPSRLESALAKRANECIIRASGTRRPEDIARSEMAVAEVLTACYETEDAEICRSPAGISGSTAATLLLLGSKIYCANVGDSRVILCRGGQALPMSEDQKPSHPDEKARIIKAGGFVMNGRVLGDLAVSRAFGDKQFKDPEDLKNSLEDKPDENNGTQPLVLEPLVLARPEVRSVDLNLGLPEPGVGAAARAPPPLLSRTSPPAQGVARDDFVLLACDGLFDVCSNQEAVSFALAQLKAHGDPRQAAQALAKRAIAKGSSDNVSVLLVLLRPDLVEVTSCSKPTAARGRDILPSPLPTAPVVCMPPAMSSASQAPLSMSSAAADAEAGAVRSRKGKGTQIKAAMGSNSSKDTSKSRSRGRPGSSGERLDFKFSGAGPLGLQLGQEQDTGWLRVSLVKPEGRAQAVGLRKHAIVVGITGAPRESRSDSGSTQVQEDIRMMPHDEAAALLKAHLEAGDLILTVVYDDELK